MRVIHVELHTPSLAEVTIVPSWWDRLLRRRRGATWMAALGRDGRWHHDSGGRLITDERVLEALTAAVVVDQALRPIRAALLSRRATAPPN